MFSRLAQNEPHLKVWLEGELAGAYNTLVCNQSEPQIRQAQGRAQLLRELLKLLTPAAKAAST